VEAYLADERIHPYREVSSPKPRGFPFTSNACLLFEEEGIVVQLDSVSHATRVEFSVDHNDAYLLRLLNGAVTVATIPIASQWIPERGLRVDTVAVPRPAVSVGFDHIEIEPVRGDGKYCLGHLRLLPR
jgi:hypothetical protein